MELTSQMLEINEESALPWPQLPGPPLSSMPHCVLTLIAVTDGAEVHVVLVVGEEEKAEPGVEGVDGYDEEDAHNVALFIGAAIAAQMHVDLGKGTKSGKTYCYPTCLPPAYPPDPSGLPHICLCPP